MVMGAWLLAACQPDAIMHIRNTTKESVELFGSVRQPDGRIKILPLQKLRPNEMTRLAMQGTRESDEICDADPTRTLYAKKIGGQEIARLDHLCGLKIWNIATDGKSNYRDIS